MYLEYFVNPCIEARAPLLHISPTPPGRAKYRKNSPPPPKKKGVYQKQTKCWQQNANINCRGFIENCGGTLIVNHAQCSDLFYDLDKIR